MRTSPTNLVLFLLCSIAISACAVDSSSSDSDSGGQSGGIISVGESTEDTTADPVARLGAFCGTEEPDDETMGQLNGDFRAFSQTSRARMSRGQFEIPVVFHILNRGSTREEGAVEDAVLIEQINIMNQAYSGATGGVDTPFRFGLAEINRVNRPEWHVLGPGTEAEVAAKQELRRGGPETLNVYVASIDGSSLGGGSGEVLGYATLPVFYSFIPSFDGVVLSFKALPGGSLERYNLGHVLVHEAGHWLGLLHTFQGECEGFFDDLVDDTPREEIPTRGDFCPTSRDSCEADPGIDPIHNHMTYTEDGCRFEFTEGQLSFMRFNSIIFRLMPV